MNPEFQHLEDVCPDTTTCEKCQRIVYIGDWPYCPHEPAGRTHHEFEAYYDEGLGAYIETRDVRKRLLKEANAEGKNRLSAGDLSARRDRVEADRAEKRRERPTGKLYF